MSYLNEGEKIFYKNELRNIPYLNIAKVKSVKKRPASDKPQPIHVMTCNSKGLTPVCETSMRRAKLVKWLHSHFTSSLFSNTFLHPCVDHFAKKKQKKKIYNELCSALGVVESHQSHR